MAGVRPRILFVAEAVTLAQVVRLRTLASALDPSLYDVHFASARFDPLVFAGTSFRQWPLTSLSPEQVDEAVRTGQLIYDDATLKRYLADDRALLDAVKPDLVIGDLRLSLTVAAPLANVPLASLINAYWSPTRIRERFPLPDHPMVDRFGPEVAGKVFPYVRPFVFKAFAAPVNRLRRAHGLPGLGSLAEVLCHGTYTLFPEVPELVPMRPWKRGAPVVKFLGPVLWSPPVDVPGGWGEPARPLLYVTLGSSGRSDALPVVLEALGELDVDVWCATAGRPAPAQVPANVRVAPFLPGERAAARAALVISNGGSTTSYQALAEGCPVLGIPSNLDQWLAMEAVEEAGAGLAVRASTLTAAEVRAAATRMLATTAYRTAARRVQGLFAAAPAAERFRAFVDEALEASINARATASPR